MARLLDNKPGEVLSVKATAAITSAYVFVKFDTDRDYCVVAGAGEDADGVLCSKAAINEDVEMLVGGIVPVLLGGTVANGAEVAANASGQAVTATIGAHVLGTMIRGGASGELGSIILGRKGVKGAAGGQIVDFGSAVLVAGTKTVSTTKVAAGDKIYLTRLVTGGTVGHLSVGTIVAATSFVINSDSNLETSTVSWLIVR